MLFDFYERYKTYSNKELLKIVKQADDYQSDAVATAEQILNERKLTEEEVTSIEKELQEESIAKFLKKADSADVQEDTLLESVLHYKRHTDSPQWIKVLLALIAAQYVWLLYLTSKVVVSFFRCAICRFEPFLVFQLFTLTYVPVIFFLVYKRRQWGWVLLFADNLFIFFSRLLNGYVLYNFQHVDNVLLLLFPLFIKLFFLLFLWRSEVINYFGVAKETRIKTILVTSVCSLVFFGFSFWMR